MKAWTGSKKYIINNRYDECYEDTQVSKRKGHESQVSEGSPNL